MRAVLRALIVEDSQDDACLLVRELQADFDLDWHRVDTAEEMRAALDRQPWDVILSDFSMARFSALAALALLRETHIDTPCILVSGAFGEDVVVEAMRAGAKDYVLKGSLTRLVPMVHRELEQAEQRREQHRSEECVSRLSAIVEGSDDAIISKSLDGVIETWNGGAEKLYGYSAAEAIGSNIGFHIPPERAGEIETILERIRAGKRVEHFETVRLKRDGARVSVSLSVSPVRDSSGAVIGASSIARDISEHELSEESLVASEVRYRRLFEAARDGILILDFVTGRITDVNPFLSELLGFSRAEMIGKTVGELSPFKDLARNEIMLDRLQTNEFVRYDDLPLETRDGRKSAVEFVSNVYDVDGRKVIQCNIRDISGRKRAESAIRASEQRVRALIENAKDAIYVLSTEGVVLQVNRAVEVLQGRPRDEIVGRPVIEAVAPEERERVGEAFASTVAGGEVSGFETSSLRADGTRVPTEISASLVDVGGERIVHAIVRDVTERKKAEKALLESEERYREIFDSSPLPMWLYSVPEAQIVAVNPAAIEIYGYSREEFLQMSLFDLRSPEEGARLKKDFADHPDPPIRWHAGIWKHRRKDGSVMEMDVHTHAVNLEGRKMRLGVMLDVTEQRKLEEQFLHAQKMEAVGRLAGGIAHDFNNLLMVVQSFADVLPLHLGDEKAVRNDIEQLRSTAGRGASLTRQLLAFSRKQVVKTETLDAGKIAAEMAALLDKLLGEDVQLEIRLDSETCFVQADRGQVEQVVMNLAVNARDAMPRGGRIVIDVRRAQLDESFVATHAGMEPGSYVQVTVSDTGTGMDAEVKKHLFEPFFTTKESGRGTGLGLATVYGIVKAAGGDVWVYSEPDKGSVFKVYFPRVDRAGAAAEAQILLASETGGTETIFLVEDEDVIRDMVREYLGAKGYRIFSAGSGHEAIRQAGRLREPVHLLLTDIVLPGPNGREVADELLRSRPEMKTIFMSGYIDDAQTVRQILSEGRDFIQKPIGLEPLARKIREVLDR